MHGFPLEIRVKALGQLEVDLHIRLALIHWMALLMLCKGTHQERTPSFSKKLAEGSTTSEYWVLGVWNKSTAAR
jgi:hypothetical protein